MELKQDPTLDFWNYKVIVFQEPTFLRASMEFVSMTERKRLSDVT